MANVFPMIGMMIANILKSIPFVGPIFGHWIAVMAEGLSIMSITKGVTLLGVAVGLMAGAGLLVLTMGGMWQVVVLFIMNVLFPLFIPKRIPQEEVKYEAWASSWERFFSRIQKVLMGIGGIFFGGGVLAVLLYLIIALPELLMKLINFIVKESVPMIVELIMNIILDESNPIGATIRFLMCTFGECPKKKEEAVGAMCTSKLPDKYKATVPTKYAACQADKEKNKGSYSKKGKKMCVINDKDGSSVKAEKEVMGTFAECMKAVNANNTSDFSKIMSGEVNPIESGLGSLDDATGLETTEMLGNLMGGMSSAGDAASGEGFTNWV